MPERIRTGEAALPPTLNGLLRRGEGYGWVRGCAVTRTASTSDIEIRVASGRVIAGGETYDISTTTKTLGEGDSQYPRKDLVLVDYQGDVRVLPGVPGQADPADREAEFTKSPAPDAAASLDGTLLAEVWVPAGATSNADLEPDDISDKRIADPGGFGTVPVLSSDPPEEELLRTRLWRNSSAGEFRAYVADADAIVALTTSTVTTFSGDTLRLVEDFEASIKGNWRGGGSEFTYTTPVFEGSAAAYWDSTGETKDYSLVGDGLPYYAEPGDTVGLTVYFENSSAVVDLGFGKSADDFVEEYRVRLDNGANELALIKTESDGSETLLGATAVSLSTGSWYWIEADYDGGGAGVHPCRVFSTTTGSNPGAKDTELAAVSSPTADSDYRGRGYYLRVSAESRIDYLTATTA
jgi:hypothetical protein